ncbi:hypothetical protein BRD00_01955 [Halobacteriales archaeon QS_8_69_26]|nr:MAG: hypothetical protein BRD00_01955 [Halobacteriales archaeon QS_8_69_26]
MTFVRSASGLGSQIDPITVRYVGLGLVGLLVVVLLYMVVRYGDADRDTGDGSDELFLPGPAYGLTGTNDVEEVLMVDDEAARAPEDEGGDRDERSGGRGSAAGREPPGGPGDPTPSRSDESRSGGEDGKGDDARFSHDVRERRDGEWLVEVSDGDRSARFEVSRTGSVLTVDPVASPGRRHGTNWVLAAERYLRDVDPAVGIERERE